MDCFQMMRELFFSVEDPPLNGADRRALILSDLVVLPSFYKSQSHSFTFACFQKHHPASKFKTDCARRYIVSQRMISYARQVHEIDLASSS